MKMVKTLLLGSAAGLMAVAGAQAADLPVKAKPVEYVKVCSLYGAGYYYIPGTDICMKVGGYIRYQANWANGGASISNGPAEGTGGRNTRTDSADWQQRTRAVATFDTRQQTQYGTLRTYLLMGFQQDTTNAAPTTSPNVYISRGFIQIAGFTFGKATSFYDFFPRAALAYHAGSIFAADTGDGGQMLAAYTAQLGNGVSASIAAEQSLRRPTAFLSASGAQYLPSGFGSTSTGNILGSAGTNINTGNPDITANIRVDGAWGAFQLAGVLHDASGGYYGTLESLGHPGNKWGWGISPGIRINTPFIAAGDYFVAVASYTQGAVAYATSTNSMSKVIWNGSNVAFGNLTDGVYGGSVTGGTATDVQLTTAWSFAAAYEHYWTPNLHTSFYGSYLKVTHNATAQSLICASGSAATVPFTATCNPDWSMWNVGSRSQWDVTSGLYLGVDVLYTRLQSAQVSSTTGVFTTSAAQGAKPLGTYTVADQGAWTAAFRIHRDIVP